MTRVLLLIALLCTACTYKKAMESAALLESAGELDQAMDAYALALAEKPGDPGATAGRDRILETQTDAAIALAEQRMQGADYEGALQALADASAIDDDRPEVYVITARAQEELEKGFKGLFAAKRYEEAYAMGLRTRSLFGNREYVSKGLLDLRAYYQAVAKDRYGKRDYAGALAALAVIETQEPDQKPLVATQRHAIVTGWADKHAAIANDLLRANNPGGAAASWIRAFEIAERPSDRQLADQTLSQLSREGAMGFRVDSASNHPRDRALVELLRARLTARPDTTLQVKSPHLVVTVLPSPSQCTESAVRKPKTTPFIAGTVDVPNPEYVKITMEAESFARSAEGAKRKADALWSVVGELSRRLQANEAELVGLLTRRPQLEASVVEAQTQRDLASSVNAPSLPQWETALTERTKALADLKVRLDELEVLNAPLQNESLQAEGEIKQSMADQQKAKQDEAAVLARREAVVPTVPRDVDDTLHWDLEDWTRVCLAELTVRVTPSWPTQQPLSGTQRQDATTTDQAHIGHPDANLTEDPKVYPKTDDELLATVDTQNLDALAPWFDALLEEHFAVRTTATAIAMSSDPRGSTTEALRLMLGAPDRLQPAGRDLFDQQIRTAWDIEESFKPTP